MRSRQVTFRPGENTRTAVRRAGVNMTAAALQRWLRQPEARQVGFRYPGKKLSVGYSSGRQILAMLTRGGPLRPQDARHLSKVNGYIARHLAQRPRGDVRNRPWRYSLMNWGHDPLQR